MQLTLTQIKRTYQSKLYTTHALKGIDLQISPGEKWLIKGESGSGKTTLLNIIGLLDVKYQGTYTIDGQDAQSLSAKQLAHLLNRCFGRVFQEYALLENETVFENVRIPLLYAKPRVRHQKKQVEEALDLVGLHGYLNKKVSEMSGGQRQRVSIARAFVNKPQVILADEPTGSLDLRTAQSVMDVFTRYQDGNKTLIIVSHREEKDIAASARFVYLKDGKIVQPSADNSPAS